jgi:hypothetical protein
MLKFKHNKKTWQPWILEDPELRERERERGVVRRHKIPHEENSTVSSQQKEFCCCF